MAPWINYHVHRWLTKEFVPNDAPWYSFPDPSKTRLGTNADGLGLVVGNPDDLDPWVKNNSKSIVSFPYRKQRKIVFIHSLWTDQDNIYGLKGFHVAAPVAMMTKGAATRGVLSKAKDNELMELVVPSLSDMMEQAGAKQVMNIEIEDLGDGKSGRRMAKEFIKEPSMLSWSPLLLKEVFRLEFDHEWPGGEEDDEVIPPIESEALLWHLVRQAKEAIQQGLVKEDEARTLWERHAQTLWVLGQGAKEKPSIREPEEKEELTLASKAFRQLMKNLERFRNLTAEPKLTGDQMEQETEATVAKQTDVHDAGKDRPSTPRRAVRQDEGDAGLAGRDGLATPNAPRGASNPAGSPVPRERTMQTRQAEGREVRQDAGSTERETARREVRIAEAPPRRSRRDEEPPEDRTNQPPAKRAKTSRRDEREGQPPDLPGGSSPSSSDGDSISSASSEGGRSRRKRRSRRQGRHEGDPMRDEGEERLSTRRLTLEVLRSFADHQEWQSKRERTKHSALKNWADSQLRLVRVLSSRGFSEARLPSTSKYLKNLCRQGKHLNRAFNILKESSERDEWACRLTDNAATYFLARGLGNDEIKDTPQGVSTFAFASRERLEQRTKKERKRQLQETFGDGKLSDEVLNELAENHLHIPTDLEEAHDQLDSMIAFLVCITGVPEDEGNVAVRGFRYAKRFLKKYRWDVRRAMREDKAFLTKYMYMVDRWWQHYLSSLLDKSRDEDDPLAKPHEQLWNHHIWFMDQELDTLAQGGAVPALSLPQRLKSMGKDARQRPGGPLVADEDKHKAKAPHQQGGKADGGGEKVAWHYKNPAPRKEWGVPAGKRFNDFFGKEVKENREGFPHFAHHTNGKTTPICVYYQAAGRCSRGPNCMMAHVSPRDMSKEEQEKIGARFKEVYAS